ncbi:4248_t:CDS:2 [Acaulospora colombiana]|uniref:4248_t:CDS:1 n=1 Tax=Acaulospora colombiana TaxID=27376 RepID=A0ACA9P486_9GLOM|nr:4248_t:CDS:2 [Acaulospora colombiana]
MGMFVHLHSLVRQISKSSTEGGICEDLLFGHNVKPQRKITAAGNRDVLVQGIVWQHRPSHFCDPRMYGGGYRLSCITMKVLRFLQVTWELERPVVVKLKARP